MKNRPSHLLFLLFVAMIPWHAAPVDAQITELPEWPVLSVRLQPATINTQGIFVQQQLLLQVRLMSKYPFIELKLDIPLINHAETVTALVPRTGLFDTYGGSGWLHETVLAVFPLASGCLVIPAMTATGIIERKGGERAAFTTRTDSMTLPVHPPRAGEHANSWWLPSRSVIMEEDYSVPLEELHTGDTVRRHVRLVAEGVRAEQLPQLHHRSTPGMTLLEGPVRMQTVRNAGGLHAEYETWWDIRIDSEYPVHFAPLTVDYFNPESGRHEQAHVSAARIEPLPVDASSLRGQLLDEARERHDRAGRAIRSLLFVLGTIFTVPLLWFLWVMRPPASAGSLVRELFAGDDDPRAQRQRVLVWMKKHGLEREDAGAIDILDSLDRCLCAPAAPPPDPWMISEKLQRLCRQKRIGYWKAMMQRLVVALLGERRTLPVAGQMEAKRT